jgi:hypothetical protein
VREVVMICFDAGDGRHTASPLNHGCDH